jgi:spore germination protein YaaH/chitodextrinase
MLPLPHTRPSAPARRLVTFAAALALVIAPSLVTPSGAAARARPDGPVLVAPRAGATAPASAVAFRWRAVRSAAGYELRLARRPSFARVRLSAVVRAPRARLLLPRGVWYWKVRARTRPASRWSAVRRLSVRPRRDVIAPSRPGRLAVDAVRAGGVTLSFTASSDEFGVAGYLILADGVRVARAAGTPATVNGLSCATPYTFTVQAVDAAGNRSADSPPARARTRACPPGTRPARLPVAPDLLAPSAPGLPIVTALTDTTVGLAWPPSTDVDGQVIGYLVQRDGVTLGQTAGSGYIATGLAPGSTHAFSVLAKDRAGHLSAPSPPLTVATLPPIPATGPLHAYLLASTDRSYDDLVAHYQQVSTVHPTYFEVRADGSVAGADDPRITGFARLHGIRVEPRFESQSPSVLHPVLTRPATTAAMVAAIARIVAANGYDGANIDFEAGAATDRDALTAFMRALATALHAQGATLSMAVSPKVTATTTGRSGFYDYPALSRVADRVFVMAWGLHWSTSPPGPISDAAWLARIIAHVRTMPHPERFVIGTQLYGFDWPDGGRATPYEYGPLRALQASVGAADQWDPAAQEPFFTYTDALGVRHTAYYANAASVEARFAQARAAGLGLGVWRLGDEDPAIWAIPSLQP